MSTVVHYQATQGYRKAGRHSGR